jgi:hypothetical protein
VPPNELRKARMHSALRVRPYFALTRDRFNPTPLGRPEVKRRRDANKRFRGGAVSVREIVLGSAVKIPGGWRAFDLAA